MFDSLSDRLGAVFDRLRGRGALTEADVRGAMREVRIALTEFAMTFPVLLLLFLGGYQLSDGIACKRKVGIANRTIADLGTRSKGVTAADVDAILAGRQPYTPARDALEVARVIDAAYRSAREGKAIQLS